MFALEKLESALAVWFNQACESNASIDGNHLKEKALHIADSQLFSFQWMDQQI
jgi:hypothetical protein